MPKTLLSLEQRLLKHSIKRDEHLIWTACLDKDGYGITWDGTRKLPAHVLAYIVWKKDYDPSLLVLHKCDIRSCINPDCLYQGTQRQNMIDCVARGRHNEATKTHCSNGHELTPDNVYLYNRVNTNGNPTIIRRCIQCCREGRG